MRATLGRESWIQCWHQIWIQCWVEVRFPGSAGNSFVSVLNCFSLIRRGTFLACCGLVALLSQFPFWEENSFFSAPQPSRTNVLTDQPLLVCIRLRMCESIPIVFFFTFSFDSRPAHRHVVLFYSTIYAVFAHLIDWAYFVSTLFCRKLDDLYIIILSYILVLQMTSNIRVTCMLIIDFISF